MLIPRQKVPALAVDTLEHGRFELAAEGPERGTVISFHRGLHCPICAKYIGDPDKRVPDFAERLGALDFVIARDYPARGELTGAV